MSNEVSSEGIRVLLNAEVEDVLNNVISEGILDEGQGASSDLRDQLSLLCIGCIVNAALEDATSMTVRSNIDAVASDSIIYKLVALMSELVKTALDDMVSVEILDEKDNRGRESI